jgi:hypothetical protein
VVLTEGVTRAEVGREWWFRAWAERESALRFARLAESLAAQRAPEVLCVACQEAAEDERRHAVLCAEVARRFRDDDPYAQRPAPGAALGPGELGASERLLYEIVAFCCVTESLNASLLLTIFESASDPMVRDASRDLLKDEVQHAKLGWAFLAHHAGLHGSPGFMAPYLGRILAAATSDNLTESDAFCARWSDTQLGYLPRSRRIEVFRECVEQVILAGMAQHGIDTWAAEQWLRDQQWAEPG